MHEQETKMLKQWKCELKLNKPKQIGKQSNKQNLVQLDKVFPSGVVILSRVRCRAGALKVCLLRGFVVWKGNGYRFNYKITIKVQESPSTIMVTRNL
jgi:hypothetical protein